MTTSLAGRLKPASTELIVIEVAACLTLLVGAGLTFQSAVRMLSVDMGLDAAGVLVGRINLRQGSYPDPAARLTFYERVFERTGTATGLQTHCVHQFVALTSVTGARCRRRCLQRPTLDPSGARRDQPWILRSV